MKLTFSLKEYCFFLLCATVVIAATHAHVGLFLQSFPRVPKFCIYAFLGTGLADMFEGDFAVTGPSTGDLATL